jgi:methionyl-tRNA synthetase
MSKFKRHTITAALPYANGPKHIGHLAGAYLPADIYARWLRSQQKDVLFICGSDEHGTAIPIQAKRENTTPQAIIDHYHTLLKSNFEELGISFDVYHRTSEKIHHETAQEFFRNLNDKKLLTEETSQQYYDEEAKTFLADRYITGTCPNCANPKAYGDQCEKCGKDLNATDLINPVSTLSGKPPVLRSTKHWFLPLADYEKWLREWILESHKDDWKINAYGQCKSWIDGGLNSRPMTRDLDWGIKVPVKDADGKVLYVWFDAPIGYISATKQLFKELSEGKRVFSYSRPGAPNTTGSANAEDWKLYWQDKETRLIHFVGKDNIVFHCIIFPVMLKAHGDYILPDNVPANEFLNLEGDKMSTSSRWSVEMHDYLADFPGKPDVLRYCLITNMPETKDSEFTWKDFQLKNNSELVGILGNFVNRTLVLSQKYYGGKVPQVDEYNKNDLYLLEEIGKYPAKISASLDQFRFREALAELMNLARAGNKYLADNEPWKIAASDEKRVRTILNISLQISANLSVLMEPFLPFSSKKLSDMLNLKGLRWRDAERADLLKAGHQLGTPALLYDKIEDPVIEAQVNKLHESKKMNESTNQPEAGSQKQVPIQKPEVTFDDFTKMDIRVGTILEAVKVPKADKLLQLKIDTGIDIRTVVSGIAGYYKPEDIIGNKVSILVNLAPRKIKGIESQGMILMAENAKGELAFVVPAKEESNNGSIIK